MSIIPFFMMFAVYGLEKFTTMSDEQLSKVRRSFILFNLILIAVFAYLQYTQRAYFLGASKVLFAIIILTALDMTAAIFFKKWFRRIIVGYLLIVNILSLMKLNIRLASFYR